MNVLLVEDDKFDQRHIAKLISTLPVNLIMATNGREAINASGEISPDCILLDYHLPGTETWSLLDYFVHRQIPVIMVTGHYTPNIEYDARDIGAIGVIDKDNLSTQLLRDYIQQATPRKKYSLFNSAKQPKKASMS